MRISIILQSMVSTITLIGGRLMTMTVVLIGIWSVQGGSIHVVGVWKGSGGKYVWIRRWITSTIRIFFGCCWGRREEAFDYGEGRNSRQVWILGTRWTYCHPRMYVIRISYRCNWYDEVWGWPHLQLLHLWARSRCTMSFELHFWCLQRTLWRRWEDC